MEALIRPSPATIVVDEERLGVTGGSYGGFMTNWIVRHTNRFKAPSPSVRSRTGSPSMASAISLLLHRVSELRPAVGGSGEAVVSILRSLCK